MFRVTIIDPAYASGKPVELPVARSGAEVKALREKYARVDAEPLQEQESETNLASGLVALESGDDFRKAIAGIIRVYTTAKKRGDLGLAARAEDACAALLGSQPFLKGDDGKPFVGPGAGPQGSTVMTGPQHTLHGIGRAK